VSFARPLAASRRTGVGVGASGVIYFSSDIENAIYKVAKNSRRGLRLAELCPRSPVDVQDKAAGPPRPVTHGPSDGGRHAVDA
jgi:hypothetical protein